MKKLVFCAVLLLTYSFISNFGKAQDGSPGENGGSNQWGGLCCQFIPSSCYHPIGLNFPESYWRTIYPTCS
jgi:hypothetical protein